ncbi:MAG: MaoC family dehydratase [Planctomycetaceae bacterium]
MNEVDSDAAAVNPRVIDGLPELRRLIGQEVGVSDWLVMDQPLIDAFAEITRDRQWIHCDPARATAESPYGTTVAHGYLTLSLISHFMRQAVSVRGDFARAINYGVNRVRFPAPAPAGARLRGRFSPQQVEEIPGGVQITWHVIVERDGADKPVLVADCIVRHYR